MNTKYHDNQRYRIHTMSMSVDGDEAVLTVVQSGVKLETVTNNAATVVWKSCKKANRKPSLTWVKIAYLISQGKRKREYLHYNNYRLKSIYSLNWNKSRIDKFCIIFREIFLFFIKYYTIFRRYIFNNCGIFTQIRQLSKNIWQFYILFLNIGLHCLFIHDQLWFTIRSIV